MTACSQALLALAVAAAIAAVPAASAGKGIEAARGGVAVSGQPYRLVALAPQVGDRGGRTVVARIDLRDGKVDRWRSLPGRYYVPAVTSDGSGGGLSGDGRTLVLTRFTGIPPRGTSFGVLDRDLRLRKLHLRGQYALNAVSPHGSRAYLIHYLIARGPVVPPGHGSDDLELRVLRLAGGKLEPHPLAVGGGKLSGVAISNASSRDGRWSYTLFYGDRHEPFLLALDTVDGRATRIDLPALKHFAEPYGVRLRRDRGGRELDLIGPATFARRPLDLAQADPLLTIDTGTFSVRGRLADPARPIGIYGDVVGESAQGRPIEMLQVGDLSLPGNLLVFGCVHGDECGASALVPSENGCPDPDLHAYVVPNLDPDGSAADSRLNARGVDLNRNFAAGWRPIGAPGTLEYAGPRPFSEPESRLAARLIRRLQPRATIWFHQDWDDRAYVRAWGQSAPAGRRFAKLAGIEFRLLPWPAGTAPNWQNHRFPGSASFVVETPRGRLSDSLRARLTKALADFGEGLEDDPGVARKG